MSTVLPTIEGLYERGLFLQAYRAAEPLGAFRGWPGVEGRILAGRLAHRVGAPRLGDSLLLRAGREAPDDLTARYYWLVAIGNRRGPWAAWCAFRRTGVPDTGPPEARSDLCSMGARLMSGFRDFDAAEAWLRRAEELAADHQWVRLERSFLLERQDRYDEALAVARETLERRPDYPPAVANAAHLLQLLDRDDEADAFLGDALERCEDASLAAQRAILQIELRRWDAAATTLDRYEQLTPMIERRNREWLLAQRSDVAYHRGDLTGARLAPAQVDGHFHRRIAERLASVETDEPAVGVEVEFIRQNYMTCGPATLSMLARFFRVAAEHLEVAAEICYGGTTDYSERRWAIENGFVPREFTLTVDNARALLARGIPFSVATVESTSAHLQIVMGYDPRRDVFIVRDPYHRNRQEWLTQEFLERYRSCGPRALALVPSSRAAELDGLELLDSDLFELYSELQGALNAHDHDRAIEVYRRLRDQDEDHRLTLQARLNLSSYEEDPVAVLASIERMLAEFPDDPRLLLRKVSGLRELGRRKDRVELLESLVAKPGTDPVFVQQLGADLADDSRDGKRAKQLLLRALRTAPYEANNHWLFANLLWQRREFDRAIEEYRFAACLSETEEQFSRSYFRACCARNRTAEALEFLRHRFERFADRSGAPATSLFQALDSIDRTSEGFDVLEEAIRRRGNVEGALLLTAADANGRYGRFERARELLASARGVAREVDRLEANARLADYIGDGEAALAAWHELLAREPLHRSAHGRVAELLEGSVGRRAALEHLRETATTYPFCQHLQQTYAHWVGRDHPAEAEKVLRAMIEHDETDVWCLRELAMRIAAQGRIDEALELGRQACRLDPSQSASHGVLGHLLAIAGQLEEAAASMRQALRNSVDYPFAIGELMRVARSDGERREALEFVREQLVEQPINGDGLWAYWEEGARVLEAEALLDALLELRQRRPDVWEAWSCSISQLQALGRFEEAEADATQATEQFPLVPRLWFDLAQVRKARGDRDGSMRALEQASSIAPGWSYPLRELSEHHREAGDLERARAMLEHAVARDPLDAANHGWLADVLADQGDLEGACAQLEQSLKIAPGYEWAFDRLGAFAEKLGQPERVVRFAREVASRRRGHAPAQMLAARALGDADVDERLELTARAIDLDPRLQDAYDLRAELLTKAGRYDDAISVCTGFPGERLPFRLEGRRAWIEAERGDLDGAIAVMGQAVTAQPDYGWGWFHLLDWLRRTERDAEYRSAAESAAESMRDDPVVFGYLGDARHRAGDKAAAEAAFSRALEVSPGYAYAARSLLELRLERGDLDGARQSLELLDGTDERESASLWGARVAAACGDLEAARERFATLCDAAESPEAFAAMREVFGSADWNDAFRDALRARIAADPTPVAAGAWMELCLESEDWEACRRELRRFEQHSPQFYEAARALLHGLARAGATAAVHATVEAWREAFAADDRLWGAVGYALAELDAFAEVVEWLASWPRRERVAPWILLNLSLALRSLDRWSEARAVSEHAVALEPDSSTPCHHAWLAADAVLAAEFDEALRRLAAARIENDDFYAFVHDSVLAVAELRLSRRGCRETTRALRRARRRYPRESSRPALRHLGRRLVSIVGARGGVARAWALWARWGAG